MHKIPIIKSLSVLHRCQFLISTKIPAQNIRNSNLRFEADEYYINMYPFYPQIFKKKEKNVYEILASSTVLTLVFINRNLDYAAGWEDRKSISMRFKEVGKILTAEPGSGREVVISINSNKQNQQYSKTLALKDLKEQQKMLLTLTSTAAQKSQGSDLQRLQQEPHPPASISMTIPYPEYIIMYKLVENSLLDLSGWKFMMEVQKRQQINKLDSKVIGDKEVEELLKN